jgi:hypothetical protein
MNFFEYFIKIKHGLTYQVTVVPFFQIKITWNLKITTWSSHVVFKMKNKNG